MKFYTTSKLSENMHETPEGYLVCVGVPIARTGEMVYGPGETPLEVGPEGTVLVTRDADEVFRPETMASFEGKPVTIGHPVDFVDPQNWKELTKGMIQNVRRGTGEQENDLVADLLITDKNAITLVKNGLREVSCGYENEYTQTGIGRGVQSNIVGNHLALVEEGRAGASYAINDHKGKGSPMKLADRIKAIFAKAQDEAMKVADEACAKDAGAGAPGTPETKTGFVSYDDFKKAMDKIESFMGSKKDDGKDATSPATENKPAETVAKDAEVASSLEDRLKKLEDMVTKLMGAQSGDAEPDSEEAGEETGDEEAEGEESEDDDFEESTMTGDTASRIEILAPGMKAKGKDAKGKALIAAYATTDGKAVIDQFTAGKIPDLKDEAQVNAIFVGASEVLKVQRAQEFSKTKTRSSDAVGTPTSGAKTPEEINEINSKHYAARASK